MSGIGSAIFGERDYGDGFTNQVRQTAVAARASAEAERVDGLPPPCRDAPLSLRRYAGGAMR